jgi:DnaJ-class molecular chaperone
MDYFHILGVQPGCSDEDVKRSYRKLALEWHPDRNKSSQATAKFKQISEAYEALRNEEKRKAYEYRISNHFVTKEYQPQRNYGYEGYGSGSSNGSGSSGKSSSYNQWYKQAFYENFMHDRRRGPRYFAFAFPFVATTILLLTIVNGNSKPKVNYDYQDNAIEAWFNPR